MLLFPNMRNTTLVLTPKFDVKRINNKNMDEIFIRTNHNMLIYLLYKVAHYLVQYTAFQQSTHKSNRLLLIFPDILDSFSNIINKYRFSFSVPFISAITSLDL